MLIMGLMIFNFFFKGYILVDFFFFSFPLFSGNSFFSFSSPIVHHFSSLFLLVSFLLIFFFFPWAKKKSLSFSFVTALRLIQLKVFIVKNISSLYSVLIFLNKMRFERSEGKPLINSLITINEFLCYYCNSYF